MDLEREKGITIKARAVRLSTTPRTGTPTSSTSSTRRATSTSPTRSADPSQACEGAILVVDADPGHRGADAGQRLPRARRRAGDHPGHQQDRPAQRRAEMVCDELERSRPSRARRSSSPPPRTGSGSTTSWRRSSRACPRRAPMLDAPLQRPRLRQPLRRLQGRDRLRADRRPARWPTTSASGSMATDPSPRSWSSATSARSPCPRRGSSPARSATSPRASSRSARPVGDTLTLATAPAAEPLPGYREPLPLVFAGIYPLAATTTPSCARRSTSSISTTRRFVYEPESSVALGFGFRCGFLGLLHMEIVQERLEREYDLDLIAYGAERRVPRQGHASGRGGRRRQPGAHATRGRDRGGQRAMDARPRSSPRPSTSARSWSWPPDGAASS